MPPKVNHANEEFDAKLNAIMSQLSTITKRLDKVDLLGEQLSHIEETMESVRNENTIIRTTLTSTKIEINTIQNNQNRTDQYNRSWSVRIVELPLSPEEEANPFKLVAAVYNKVFLPILQGAVEAEAIPKIPSCEQLLERAHVLPSTKAGAIKPIICRFFNRDYRAICFIFKKEFALREAPDLNKSGAGAGVGKSQGTRLARYAYPFYEDLTTATFKKLKELQADSRVESCWSVNGQLRYRLVGSEQVRKVKQTLDSIESILSAK